MTFTNITRAGVYLQCCHREVEPGGSFTVSWDRVRGDRGLRMAMNSGALAWKADAGDGDIPESPRFRDVKGAMAAVKKAAAAAAEKKAAEIAARQEADNEAVMRNMSSMGSFAVPQPIRREVRTAAVVTEKPVTRDDVISGEKPRSLADIRRHNRAVKEFGDGERPGGH